MLNLSQILERLHLDVVRAVQVAQERDTRRDRARGIDSVEVHHGPTSSRGQAAEQHEVAVLQAPGDHVLQGRPHDAGPAPVHARRALVGANVAHPSVAAALRDPDPVVAGERAGRAEDAVVIHRHCLGVGRGRHHVGRPLRARLRVPAPAAVAQQEEPICRVGRTSPPIVDARRAIVACRQRVHVRHADLLVGLAARRARRRHHGPRPLERQRRRLWRRLLAGQGEGAARKRRL
mmetsp:Transcript_16195/g.48103  ORF Transcript_16195/g.48103 Transcript_16195/m.48103 type:complete len:234 (+) Transcript_16195:605-1306(+)